MPARPESATASGLDVRRPGEVGYTAALELQREAARRLRAGEGPEVLFLLTHPPTITLGRRAATDHLLETPAALTARGVEVVETDRGGDVTYHGPGQVVGYPILDLRRRRSGPREHLRYMETVLIDVLAKYGVKSFRDPEHTGVWTDLGKVVAMGIRVSGGVSLHGFALNVNTAPDAFASIVPCGIRGRPVASMAALLEHELDMDEVMDRIEESFA